MVLNSLTRLEKQGIRSRTYQSGSDKPPFFNFGKKEFHPRRRGEPEFNGQENEEMRLSFKVCQYLQLE